MKVELLTITPNCEELIEKSARVCYDSPEKPETRKQFIQSLIKRGHEGCIEHGIATFHIQGVSRALTHQLVRHRVASYNQRCLSGDTKILRYNTNRKALSIKELYERQKTEKIGRNKLMILRSMNENSIIVPNKFIKVFQSGIKNVYEITTELGYKIKTSLEHKFFDKDGEITLKELNVGNFIYVNGIELYRDKEWFEEKYNNGYSTVDISRICNIKTTTARKWKNIHQIKTNYSYKRHKAWNKGITGVLSHAYGLTAWNKGKKCSQLEGDKNGSWKGDNVGIAGGYARGYKIKIKKDICELCNSHSKTEIHHKDRNPKNPSIDNLIELCIACHKLLHRGTTVKKAILDRIVSIEYSGKEMTYDIEMKSPYHNFVANGFIVHNSQRYVKETAFEYVIPDSIVKHILHGRRFKDIMASIRNQYALMIRDGIPAEDARFLLPNACCTEIVMTCNFREWRHFLKLRLDKHAQWEIRELANRILKILYEQAPSVFEDFTNTLNLNETT